MTTLDEIVKRIDELEIKKQHSTEFSVNAKGQWSGKVKVYGLTPEEAYQEAYALAEKMEQVIKTKNQGWNNDRPSTNVQVPRTYGNEQRN